MSILTRNTLITLFLLSATMAHAELKATVDRPTLFFGESFTLTITSDKNTNSQPDFTLLDAVFHVGQTGKSSSTQIINGSVSTQTTWQVLLVPKSIGSHIIPPLEVDGERTQAIKITVNKPDPNAQAKGDIYIEVETDKTSAFVQEEIQLTVRLMYAINLKNGALSEPGANGVIVQQINKGANYTTQRNGKTYQVLERKYAMFAENSGTLTLNPLVFEGEVTDNSRQSFGMFQRGRPIRKVSEMLELEIKQIPANFINKDWLPAKEVTLKQSWSQNKPYQVGDPITRTITLTAAGLSETQLPDFESTDIKGAKIYQDKTDTMTRTDGEQLIATKVIKYAVIPSEKGVLEIPEMTLDWFNTNTQTTQTAHIPATSLKIEAAETSTTQAPKAINFNATDIPVTQVEPIQTQPENMLAQPLWKYLTFTFATLWLVTTILWYLKSRRHHKPETHRDKKINYIAINKINQMVASDVQNTLINWWNQEHQQKVTNLGQIKSQVVADEALKALDQLQQLLYGNVAAENKIDWLNLIKKGYFTPRKTKHIQTIGLPELYG